MPKLKDLTGERFGQLIVLSRDNQRKSVAWICKCDCGQIVSRTSDALRTGRSLSCGCLKNNKHRKNIAGQIFGQLTAIQYGKPIFNNAHEQIATWQCKCSCGNIINVPTYSLLNGNTKSCGCLRKKTFLKKFEDKDLTGKRFDKLIVIRRILNKNNKTTYYECKCDCGNIKIIRGADLSSGKTHSCGCIRYSIGEKHIKNILTLNNIKFQMEYVFTDLSSYRFDFAILNDQNKVIRLIQFDGPQHKKETKFFHGSLKQTQQRDKIKNNYALNNNIPLIRIPYNERDKITLKMLLEDQYLIKST